MDHRSIHLDIDDQVLIGHAYRGVDELTVAQQVAASASRKHCSVQGFGCKCFGCGGGLQLPALQHSEPNEL